MTISKKIQKGIFRNLNILMILVCFQNAPELSAQSNETPYAHLDRPFYIVGDDIWYKAYLLGNNPLSSAMVHVELVSPEGTVLIQQNLKVVDKMTVGNIKIPLGWQEGNYLFRIYTLWQSDSVSTKAFIFKKIVPIYDDLAPKMLESKPVLASEPVIQPISFGGFKIENQGKAVFNRRENGQLFFKITDSQNQPVEANLSASIIEEIPLSNNDILESFQEIQSLLQRDKTTQLQNLKPESQLTVLGKVKDPRSERPVSDQYLSLYMPTQRKFIRLTATEGLFKTALTAFEDKTDIQILSLNPNRSYPLVIESIYNVSLPTYKAATAPTRTIEINKYLERHQLRRRSEDIFNTAYLASPIKDTITNSAAAYQPDRSYNLKDFVDLNTLEDFIREVMLNSRVMTTDKGKTVRLNNKDENKLYNLAPWYLVDGLFVNDEEAALKLPLSDVKQIDIFNRKKTIENHFDWLMFRYGVIAITTNKNARLLAGLDFKTTAIAGFNKPLNWATSSLFDPKTPDFRPVLTWQNQLKTDKTGVGNLTFRTSDIKGKYAVRIMGIAADNKPVCSVFYIDVK